MAAVEPSISIEKVPGEVTYLPEEVLKFLNRGGVTLLVKGESGSGKTTFVLELLRAFGLVEAGCRGVYVTSRVGGEEFFEMYPWFKGSLSPDCIIDATSPQIPSLKVDLAAPDAYYLLPEPLKRVYDLITEMPRTGLVVFDSWDALAGHFEMTKKPFEVGPWTRKEIETHLLDLLMHKSVNFVLIAESADVTLLDYVVDGVVELGMRYPRGLVREMVIRKLRGVPIHQPRYLFTLHDGRFNSFKPVEPKLVILNIPKHPRKPEPIEDSSEDRVSTGISDFDKLANGGFVKGSVNMLEVGRDVGEYYHTLSLPMIISWLNLGRGVSVIPSKSTPPKKLTKYLSSWVSPENMGHIQIFKRIPDEIVAWPMLELPEAGELQKKFEEYLRKRVEWTKLGVTYSFVGADSLESWYGVEALERGFGLQADFIKDFGQVDVWVLRETQKKLIDMISPLATTYWKMGIENNTLTIQGINPPTNLHAVELRLEVGYPYVEFTPIE